ncbi:DUF3794 and LysM peptidoglycan-binding domain-containing protein [Massiliimalia timonensis]|uniref:DUF3794 and LysM peptidoglycan-binding domain-containing protein n=1 Tax=Massiliimalia timonensis TaxID=1987501 RepID=UPI000B8B562B|nr:SPOCS domain-containing protein [Massiliimalia timonensis]
MDYQISTEEMKINEQIANMMAEQSIELDYMLPDYCPEIFKVLRAQMKPNIISERISGNKLVIDGVADITVIYLGGENYRLNRIEQKQTFTKTVELGEDCDGCFVSIRANCENFSCRAQNSRRLEIKGNIGLGIVIYRNKTVCAVCGCPQLQIHHKPLQVCDKKFFVSKEFAIREELQVGSGKPPIKEIIDYNADAFFHDYKLLANKVICKGELQLRTIYLSEQSSAPEILEHSIPLSQIMDCEGVDEDYICTCRFEVVKYDLDLQVDQEGNCAAFSVEIGVRVYCEAAVNHEMMAVDDCYSTSYEVETESDTCTVEMLTGELKHREIWKYPFKMNQGALSVIYDIRCHAANISYQTDQGKIMLMCNLQVGILAADQENIPVWTEQFLPCEIALDEAVPDAALSFIPQVTVRSADYHMLSAEEIELRAELEVTGLLYTRKTVQLITSVTPQEDMPKTRADDAALRIYFADAGESLWEIAKRYNTSVAAILEQNDMEKETLSSSEMVFIPIID